MYLKCMFIAAMAATTGGDPMNTLLTLEEPAAPRDQNRPPAPDWRAFTAVSYTHLTLPTNREV